MTSDLLVSRSTKADGADTPFTLDESQAVGLLVDQSPGAIARFPGEAVVSLEPEDLEVDCPRQRNTVLLPIDLVLGRVELDLHAAM
ncbi:hypothetical protein BHK69_01400 [Bosea vaviloviae]|uniref:Uncharacterized protein n=1 Tax=Bosea vaviloviae TaxID=1526658 RepID=A0A1D7TW32_9HYPH|nr:hypothetical protein BHK69_01400 [Bosea vaviloviae]